MYIIEKAYCDQDGLDFGIITRAVNFAEAQEGANMALLEALHYIWKRDEYPSFKKFVKKCVDEGKLKLLINPFETFGHCTFDSVEYIVQIRPVDTIQTMQSMSIFDPTEIKEIIDEVTETAE